VGFCGGEERGRNWDGVGFLLAFRGGGDGILFKNQSQIT
jgi:hypothetical protein